MSKYIVFYFTIFVLIIIGCNDVSNDKYNTKSSGKITRNNKGDYSSNDSVFPIENLCKRKLKIEKIADENESIVLKNFYVSNKNKASYDSRDSILIKFYSYNTKLHDLKLEIIQETPDPMIKKYPNILKINNTSFYIDSLTTHRLQNFYLWFIEFYTISFANQQYLIMYAKDGNIPSSAAPQEPLFVFDITDKNKPEFIFYDINFTRDVNCFCDFNNDGFLNYITSDNIYTAFLYTYIVKNNIFMKDGKYLKLLPNGNGKIDKKASKWY